MVCRRVFVLGSKEQGSVAIGDSNHVTPDEAISREVMEMDDFQKQMSRLRRNRAFASAFDKKRAETEVAFQIRRLRETKGWTQNDLAKKAGCSQQAISAIEQAATNVIRYRSCAASPKSSMPMSSLRSYPGKQRNGSFDVFLRKESGASASNYSHYLMAIRWPSKTILSFWPTLRRAEVRPLRSTRDRGLKPYLRAIDASVSPLRT